MMKELYRKINEYIKYFTTGLRKFHKYILILKPL